MSPQRVEPPSGGGELGQRPIQLARGRLAEAKALEPEALVGRVERVVGEREPAHDRGHAALEASPVRLGANVRHPTFGSGFVTDVEGSGAHARVQVNFEDAGSKWLVLAYANLQPA